MQDIKRVNLTDGAQVFEYKGMALYRYNASLKVAGDSVKVVFYQDGILTGFPKNKKSQAEKDDKDYIACDPEKRWEKTGRTAKRRLYDYVAANLNGHKDHRGKKQSFKFFTCTFRDDVKKLDDSNRYFKGFIGRLNYFFTRGESPDFLKYVAVPELQMENNRYVWHYHVLFFNMPYIPVSGDIVERHIADGRLSPDYDKRDTLFYIWGQGSVNIAAVKFSDTYNVAGYIAKYIGKGLDSVFEYAMCEKNLYKKRFLHSMGLIKPRVMVAFLNKQQRQQIVNYFADHSKKFKRKGGEIGAYYETFSAENEFIGKLFGINFRAPKKHISVLQNMFDRYSYGFC